MATSRGGAITFVLAGAVFLAAFGGVWLATGGAVASPPILRGEADLRREMRAALAGSEFAPVLTQMEHAFPEEYARFESEIINGYRFGLLDRQGANEKAFKFSARLVKANLGVIAAAPPQALADVARTQAAALRALESRPELCVGVAEGKLSKAPDIEDFSPHERRVLMDASRATLTAVEAGRRTPTEYRPLTAPEQQSILRNYKSLGGSEAALQSFGLGSPSKGPADAKCRDYIALMSATVNAGQMTSAKLIHFGVKHSAKRGGPFAL